MAAWSSFNRFLVNLKNVSTNLASRYGARNVNQVREMSDHGHKVFVVSPSRWQYEKFKDLTHLYTLVGLIPLGMVSLYCNVFIGPAELQPIPEGYVPKEHEYHRHPITRFFKQYMMESEQEAYEKHLHGAWSVVDQAEFRRIEKEVKDLQSRRADYKHWYYISPETKVFQDAQQDNYEMEMERTVGR